MLDTKLFLDAQNGSYGGYADALAEIRAGRKRSHWIWYIFPQMKGLGRSYTSERYGIASLEDARAYLAEPTLRARLLEITGALLALDGDIRVIFPSPDDKKVRSCMTLFRAAEPELTCFQQVLDKFYGGKADRLTEKMLEKP